MSKQMKVALRLSLLYMLGNFGLAALTDQKWGGAIGLAVVMTVTIIHTALAVGKELGGEK